MEKEGTSGEDGTMSQQKLKFNFKFVMKLKMRICVCMCLWGRGWGRKSQLGGQLRIEIETRTSLENEQENPLGDPLNWRC